MSLMGLEASYPRPPRSQGVSTPEKSPDWLGAREVIRPHPVGATDIPDMHRRAGVVSRVASLDWCSREVLAWRLSQTLGVSCGLEVREEALAHGHPAICNRAPGRQLTSPELTSRLTHADGRLRMDRQGGVSGHMFGERWWRTVTYAEGSWNDDVTVPEVIAGIGDSFQV